VVELVWFWRRQAIARHEQLRLVSRSAALRSSTPRIEHQVIPQLHRLDLEARGPSSLLSGP
jgi:hypothetical protein